MPLKHQIDSEEEQKDAIADALSNCRWRLLSGLDPDGGSYISTAFGAPGQGFHSVGTERSGLDRTSLVSGV